MQKADRQPQPAADTPHLLPRRWAQAVPSNLQRKADCCSRCRGVPYQGGGGRCKHTPHPALPLLTLDRGPSTMACAAATGRGRPGAAATTACLCVAAPKQLLQLLLLLRAVQTRPGDSTSPAALPGQHGGADKGNCAAVRSCSHCCLPRQPTKGGRLSASRCSRRCCCCPAAGGGGCKIRSRGS